MRQWLQTHITAVKHQLFHRICHCRYYLKTLSILAISASMSFLPLHAEEALSQSNTIFDNFVKKIHPAKPPVCGGTDLTKTFSKNDQKKFASQSKAIINGNAKFWKIEKSGVKPSYLLGTMHVSDPKIITLSKRQKDIFDKSDRLVLELSEIAETDSDVYAKKIVLDPDFITPKAGESFKDLLTSEQFLKFQTTLEEHGLPYDTLANVKPWIIWTTLSIPTCETKRLQYGYRALDTQLGLDAKKQNKPVLGLESVDEQISALKGLPISFYAESIEDMVQNTDLNNDIFYTQMRLYQKGHIGELFVLEKMFKSNVSAENQRIFYQILVDQRNDRMAERAQKIIEQGNSFIAVGAGHLPGSKGLVEQLRQKGFTLTAVDR